MVFIEFASVLEFVSFADTFKSEYGESISQRKLSRKVVLRHGDATIPSSSYDPTALEVLCLLKHTRRNCHTGFLQSFSKWPAANVALIAHDFCLSRTHADNKVVAPLSGASFSVRFWCNLIGISLLLSLNLSKWDCFILASQKNSQHHS